MRIRFSKDKALRVGLSGQVSAGPEDDGHEDIGEFSGELMDPVFPEPYEQRLSDQQEAL
jgi:hypothetical protein